MGQKTFDDNCVVCHEPVPTEEYLTRAPVPLHDDCGGSDLTSEDFMPSEEDLIQKSWTDHRGRP